MENIIKLLIVYIGILMLAIFGESIGLRQENAKKVNYYNQKWKNTK